MNTPTPNSIDPLVHLDLSYRHIFDHSRDGIILHDLIGRILLFNHKALDLFGYSSEQLGQLRISQLHPSGMEDQGKAALSSVLKQGEVTFETLFQRQDGSVFPAEISASLFEMAGKQVVQGIIRDITERKRVETALQQQIEKERLINTIALRIRESLGLQACLQTTVDEIRTFLQTDRVLIYCFNNKDWSGQVPVESVDSAWGSVHQEAFFDPCFGAAYAELFRRGQIRITPDIYKANYRDCHLNFLEQFQVRASLAVPIIQGQELWGLILAHHCQGPRQWQDLEVDLIQKLATQVAIAVHQAELYEQMQSELIERERITEELQVTRDEALKAAQVKSDFLATMSHEIRTPMNGIIGMTGILLDTDLTQEQQHYANTIRNCGDSLLTIINDILDFSKIESGKLRLEESTFELNTCIEDALTLLSTKADEKGIHMSYSLAPTMPNHWIGDVTRLRQILVNLLGNAIKFTDKGQVTVEVKAIPIKKHPTCQESESVSPDRYELEFVVIDTGIGIPANKMDRLFQSFSQVDTSISRQYGGTGLGLAISKKLCEVMGGKMWAESQFGQGSRFYFTIESQVDARNLCADITWATKRILIVAQASETRDFLQQQCQTLGMEVYTAQSSYEAIGIIAYEKIFDVIFLIPSVSGGLNDAQLAETIRAKPGYRQIPIVMLTSQADDPLPPGSSLSTQLQMPVDVQSLRASLLNIFCEPLQKKISIPPPSSIPNAAMGQQYPLKILVAEDNLVNQQLARQWLKNLGYRAEIVSNGFEVLDALHQQSYDLILMDVQMPEMDGLTATQKICQEWSAERPKIIAMTANAMQGDRERCLSAGMDAYISKPIRVPELIQVIQDCCVKV